MTSVTTAVPVGPISDWCIKQYSVVSPTEYTRCGNATDGSHDHDYQSICCDGTIVNTARDLVRGGRIRVNDLVCCQLHGPQKGGLFPLANAATECSTGTPIPLASLAATNNKYAQSYTVTYKNAAGMGMTGDWVRTKAPTCLWANTAKGAQVTPVTVLAAPQPTLPTTTSSNANFGFVTPGSTPSGTTPPSGSSPTGSPKSSSASANPRISTAGLLLVGLVVLTPLLS